MSSEPNGFLFLRVSVAVRETQDWEEKTFVLCAVSDVVVASAVAAAVVVEVLKMWGCPMEKEIFHVRD